MPILAENFFKLEDMMMYLMIPDYSFYDAVYQKAKKVTTVANLTFSHPRHHNFDFCADLN